MPTSWTQTGIYSLANIIYGAPFASKQFNTEGNGKPIIRIRDLKDQQFATYTTEMHPKGYLLQPGDIVRLDTKVDQELSVYVGDIQKFNALPGSSGKNYAVRITKVLKEEEEEDE